MNISERIIQFLDCKDISKNKFYIKTGLSNGFLDKKPNIGADKIEIIHSNYPEINLEWLITGEGPMLKEEKITPIYNSVVNESPVTDSEIIQHLNKEIEEHRKAIKIKQSIIAKLK